STCCADFSTAAFHSAGVFGTSFQSGPGGFETTGRSWALTVSGTGSNRAGTTRASPGTPPSAAAASARRENAAARQARTPQRPRGICVPPVEPVGGCYQRLDPTKGDSCIGHQRRAVLAGLGPPGRTGRSALGLAREVAEDDLVQALLADEVLAEERLGPDLV